jgi:hypothetical protein
MYDLKSTLPWLILFLARQIPHAPMTYHYTDSSGEIRGPVSQSQLQAMYNANQLSSTSQVRKEGTQDWIPLNFVLRSSVSAALSSARAPAIQRVAVTDIEMKFGSMVSFMVKWAFAAIPAFIIISVVLFFVFLLLSVFVGGLSALFSHH